MVIGKEKRKEILRFAITGTLVTIILYVVYLPLSFIMSDQPGKAYSIGFAACCK